MSKSVTVTFDVSVWDEELLIETARAKYVADGDGDAESAASMIGSAAEALVWLLDPGISPLGSSIENSSTETFGFDDADADESEEV